MHLGLQALAGFELQRLQEFDHRGFFETHIFGRGTAETGFASGGLGSQNGAQFIEPDLFANVVKE